MKIEIVSRGSAAFPADSYAEPAIREALAALTSGAETSPGEDIGNTVGNYTDGDRARIHHDEYAVVTEDDGKVLWEGWLGYVPEGTPAPDDAARELDAANEVHLQLLEEIFRNAGSEPDRDLPGAVGYIRWLEGERDRLLGLLNEAGIADPDDVTDPFGASAFRGHSPGCACPDCEGAREDAASTAGDDFVQDRHADYDPGELGGMSDAEFYDRTSGAGQ